MNQHYFDVPFAFAGDVTAIPDPLQTGGTVSFTEGWNYNYQRNLSTDPAALPIDRSTMNWLFKQITTALQALQQQGVPEWITAAQNGGVSYSYGKGAVVLWSASGNAPFSKFVNLTAGNTNTPSLADPQGLTTGWQIEVDPISTAAQASAGTDDASIMTPLKVAQQTALRALLAGNSSQVFNVATAVAATQAVPLAQMNARLGSTGPFDFRNKLHNPLFNVNQRGYVSGTNTTVANQLTLDRWKVVTSGQNVTFSASGNGFIVTAPSGGYAQVIEGLNIEGGTYCLSWTGTATATVNGSSVANGGNFTLPANTNATVIFSSGTVQNPQLEIGTVPTPVEQRPFTVELQLCQRFYVVFDYVGGVSTVSPSTLGFLVPTPVTMRAVPSATNVAAGSGSGYAATYNGSSWFQATVGANSVSASLVFSNGVQCTYAYSGAVQGWPGSISIAGTFSADL